MNEEDKDKKKEKLSNKFNRSAIIKGFELPTLFSAGALGAAGSFYMYNQSNNLLWVAAALVSLAVPFYRVWDVSRSKDDSPSEFDHLNKNDKSNRKGDGPDQDNDGPDLKL